MSTSSQNTIATENSFELLKRLYENENTDRWSVRANKHT